MPDGSQTSAADVLLVAFNALADPEQEDLLLRLREARLSRIEAEDSQTGLFLKSLRRACEHLGHVPTKDEYQRVSSELVAQGKEPLASYYSIRQFFGSWRLAVEALTLSEDQTTLAVEARFQKRMLGRPHQYTEETMREALAECVEFLGRVPTITEYIIWRRRKVDLAKAQGRDVFIPGEATFRDRYGSWEKALLALGYSAEEVAARLDPGKRARLEKIAPYRWTPGKRRFVEQALENE